MSWAKHKSFSNAAIVNTYRVTTTADTTPASCPATTTEPCTLRQAVTQANTDGTLDKIQVPANASPYLLESDQLNITDASGVVIAGAGQAKTVVQADATSATYPFRVLQISNGSPVQVSNITIKDGHSNATTEDGYGGGIEVLSGALTMRNSTITANTADNDGGGIYVAGQNSINGSSGTESQAYLKNVTISANSAVNGGGGLDVEGQALMQGTVTGNTLTSSFSEGAGIRLGDDGDFYPSLSASDLTVAANSGASDGGGIYNGGSLALTGGVIGGPAKANGNTAEMGGGLYNDQVATLHNVTVQHNFAENLGGGVYNDDRLSMNGGSLSKNHANISGGLDNEEHATLQNVDVSGNKTTDLAGGIGTDGGSLSLSGGSIAGNSTDDQGGGLYINSGAASINGTSITGNHALFAGGIFSQAPLTLLHVQLGTAARPNVAQFDGGGLYTLATGATIVSSTIEGNQALNANTGFGGGIFNQSGADDELRQTTVTGNSSGATGGGVTNFGGTMSILTSTISANRVIGSPADAFGGGIANMPDNIGDTGTLKMVNDTLTGNQAGGGTTAGVGGGLDNEAQASATLTNVTISRNRAGASGSGGGIYNDGQAALRGTILSGNTAVNGHSNCLLPVALTSNGYNLSSDSTCALTGIGDQTAVNPLLGPLANNGGPTQTMALKAGSPAIDAVQFCPPPKTDQRGVKRQGPCDVGAYERVPDK